jgi:molybdopterin synthase catalytic subunit
MPSDALHAILTGPLDPAALAAAVAAEADRRHGAAGRSGAIVSFLGVVRAENEGRPVTHLEYEAHAPLALKAFARIEREAAAEWPAVTLGMHHRVGRLAIGEASVVIAAAAPHRADAFAACRFAIERLKQIAPIWKREHFAGGETWIEGATADPDDEAARREALRRACG